MTKYFFSGVLLLACIALVAYTLMPQHRAWPWRPYHHGTRPSVNVVRAGSGSMRAITDSVEYRFSLRKSDPQARSYDFVFVVQPKHLSITEWLAKGSNGADAEKYYQLNAANDFALLARADTIRPKLYALENTGGLFNGLRFSLVFELDENHVDDVHAFIFANKFLDTKPLQLAYDLPR